MQLLFLVEPVAAKVWTLWGGGCWDPMTIDDLRRGGRVVGKTTGGGLTTSGERSSGCRGEERLEGRLLDREEAKAAWPC